MLGSKEYQWLGLLFNHTLWEKVRCWKDEGSFTEHSGVDKADGAYCSWQSRPYTFPMALIEKWFACIMAVTKRSRNLKYLLAPLKPFQ